MVGSRFVGSLERYGLIDIHERSDYIGGCKSIIHVTFSFGLGVLKGRSTVYPYNNPAYDPVEHGDDGIGVLGLLRLLARRAK
jgi:hypothetical protein